MQGIQFEKRSERHHDIYLAGRKIGQLTYSRKGEIWVWSIKMRSSWPAAAGVSLTAEDWREISNKWAELAASTEEFA